MLRRRLLLYAVNLYGKSSIIPNLLSAYIEEDILYLAFNTEVIINSTLGVNLTSDASALSTIGIDSGSGTTVVAIQLNRTPVDTEVITIEIDTINDINSINGEEYNGVGTTSVFFIVGLTPYVNFDSYINFDTYVNLD